VSPSGRTVTRRAHAKINVFLRVEGRRDDGYHDIESLIVPISLYDDVTLREADPGTVSVGLKGDPSLVDALSEAGPDENLATRALSMVSKAWRGADGETLGAAIELTKRIPVAAGLGGGSADAAATLLAAKELWGASADAEPLASIAASLGSDVLAMMAGEAVLVGGRGEHVTPVHVATTWWVLKPLDFPVRASDAYGWWDETCVSGPDAGVLIAAAETGDLELLGHALFNDLQSPVIEHYPQVAETIQAFIGAGALGAFMSGSGPTVAALARHVGHASQVADAIPGSSVVSAPPM
jgi:4-diphosphocytidyl-2-C-methyl-D-erythritol kinase